MSSWFGKKKDADEQGGESSNMARDAEDNRRDPTERDRLLPAENSRRLQQPHSDGYLDPDDPAVSPYNLWTVRAIRYLTIFFAYLTVIWWALLFVSIFVSPPGLHTRGSGFFDFGYTTLTLGLLLVSLLFFASPSTAMKALQGCLAGLLLVDLIIIVAVPRVRAEEGPPGIASVVWATLMALWCVLTERIVESGKKQEEERLTGRAETRRTLSQWLGVLIATTILAVYIVIVVLMTGTLVLRSRDATLEMAGHRYFVDNDKYEVHLACVGDVKEDKSGKRSPTILLEGGEMPVEYDFEPWLHTAYLNGTIDRYCYWDRPGYAYSDNGPSPLSAGGCAEDLATALAVQGEEGPWILVSAGYGSIVSRIFGARHRKQISGYMLIDPLHEDLLHRIGSPTRGFLLWAYGVISPLGIQRIAGALFQGRTREDRVWGRQSYQNGKFQKAQLQENLVAESLTKSEVATARTIQTPEVPLVVISSGIEVRKSDEWSDKQSASTNITENLLSWDVVNKAPHYVWRTLDGREIMEKRLGQLVKAARKMDLATE